jgi:hypothetical protein
MESSDEEQLQVQPLLPPELSAEREHVASLLLNMAEANLLIGAVFKGGPEGSKGDVDAEETVEKHLVGRPPS